MAFYVAMQHAQVMQPVQPLRHVLQDRQFAKDDVIVRQTFLPEMTPVAVIAQELRERRGASLSDNAG